MFRLHEIERVLITSIAGSESLRRDTVDARHSSEMPLFMLRLVSVAER